MRIMVMDQNNNNNLMENYQQQQFANMDVDNNNEQQQQQMVQIYMGDNENYTIAMLPPQSLTPIMIPMTMPVTYAVPTNVMPIMNVPNQNVTSVIQMNGRKVLGPPENWVGPPPSGKCELFVRRIPKDLNDVDLVQPFLRFGQLYEMRLPLDYNNQNRGYAYIKYTNEEDAGAALEVMQHYFILPGLKFEIQYSYEKSRLYLTNVPAHLSVREIEHKLRQVFPTMQCVYFQDMMGMSCYTRDECDEYAANGGNRGNLIIEFGNHSQALEAKKHTNPGVIRLWGVDIKVLWANAERETDLSNSNKTLYMRNIDLCVNPRDLTELLAHYVPRNQVLKVTRVRTSAFVDFSTRECAEFILQKLQGSSIRARRLEIEWAKPCEQHAVHRLRSMDFDAVLRLKCMANNWMIPIIMFGTYFEEYNLQYGVVVLRNNEGMVRAIFCILQPHELVDIQSRMCEVVCVLIETIGCFPDCNYTFFAKKDTAHLLGMVQHTVESISFCACKNVPPEFAIDFAELTDLSCAVALLVATPEENLLAAYRDSFRCHSLATFLPGFTLPYRLIGTIMPKYRNKPALHWNLNDTQIVLALCFANSGTNIASPSRPHMNMSVSLYDTGCEHFGYMSIQLLPISLTQSRGGAKYILSHVLFGNTNKYYHPDMRVMSPPLWVSVCSYATSLKQQANPSMDIEDTISQDTEGNYNMDIETNQNMRNFWPNGGALLPTPPYPGVRSA